MRDAVIELVNVRILGGLEPPEEMSRKRVFAALISVKRSEFYMAHREGMQADAVFEVHAAEYEDENRVEHDGKSYQVYRTYVYTKRRHTSRWAFWKVFSLSASSVNMTTGER